MALLPAAKYVVAATTMHDLQSFLTKWLALAFVGLLALDAFDDIFLGNRYIVPSLLFTTIGLLIGGVFGSYLLNRNNRGGDGPESQ